MRRMVVCLVLCLLVSSSICAQLPPQGYIGLWADENRSWWCVEGMGLFTIYCFALPPSEGLDTVEFQTVASSPAIGFFPATFNSDILLYMGGVPGELVATFRNCQVDWAMVYSVQIFLGDLNTGSITLEPYPGFDHMKIVDCTLDLTEALLYSRVFVNDPLCHDPYLYPPHLSYVTVQDESHIVATFDIWLWENPAEDPGRYPLFPKENPTDTIPVSSAELVYYNQVLLTLEESLIQGVTYTLIAEGMCNDWGCCTTEVDFMFAPVAALLQGFSADNVSGGVELNWRLADAGSDISFAVSRRTEMLGSFEELGYIDIERYGDTYTCVDTYAEPGESYVYRVDYELGGETGVLFETGAVQTPSLPLTLHQNVPNPFNPVTEISYYLPAVGDVLLEVYDVTGKRVSTLVKGQEEKGLHVVTWQGTDDGGRSVASGIYFYRLRAGKEIISKKMVLLR